MFGMLDYRAHKLYIILFFIPNTILILFSVLGLPLINYSIGLIFSDQRIFQILISLGSILIIESLWIAFIYMFINKAIQFIFSLFVDVIPHDGRTKEQAQWVVWNGDKAIRQIAMDKHPTTWTDELIYQFPKNDWIQNLFYRENVIKRLRTIQSEYLLSPELEFNEYEVKRILTETNLEMSWKEKAFGNPQIRRMIIGYSFFLLLILFNPFS